jgi:hypothetical protein
MDECGGGKGIRADFLAFLAVALLLTFVCVFLHVRFGLSYYLYDNGVDPQLFSMLFLHLALFIR